MEELIEECRAHARELWHEGHHPEARRLDEVADRWEAVMAVADPLASADPARSMLRALPG